MLSWADEEIPSRDVKLGLELEPQEALIKSPNLALCRAPSSPVQPHMAPPAQTYSTVILPHHLLGVKMRQRRCGQMEEQRAGRRGGNWMVIESVLIWKARWRKVHGAAKSPDAKVH